MRGSFQIARVLLGGVWRFITKIKEWIIVLFIGLLQNIINFFISLFSGNFFATLTITPVTLINYTINLIWVSLIVSLFSLILFVYNNIQSLITNLNNNFATSSVDSSAPNILDLSLQVLKASGMWDAIVDVYNLSIPFISFLLFAILSKHTLSYLEVQKKILLDLANLGSVARISNNKKISIGNK